MSRYVTHVSPKTTPQSEPIPGKKMVKNSAGGYTFQVGPFERLLRFLILGCDKGTYYASARKLTQENAACVNQCADVDYIKAVDTIVQVSLDGRAPKNDPAIFALALLASHKDNKVRKYALSKLNDVCRIGTHLFQFVDAVNELRGWGRGLREAVSKWYSDKTPDKVAYQVTKYQQRGGWSHRDVLRLTHPKVTCPKLNSIFQYITQREKWQQETQIAPSLLYLTEQMKNVTDPKQAAKLIVESEGDLAREHIPTSLLNSPEVWDALLQHMPPTAMVRNLNKMTAVGLLKPLSKATKKVCAVLLDKEVLKRARLHPVTLLNAYKQYGEGRGLRGSLTWTPVSQIVDALHNAFYLAFDNVEPTGKSFLLGLDVSGSMGWCDIAGTSLTAREGATVMSMVTARTETNYAVMAFCGQFVPIDIQATDSLETVINKTSALQFGSTDCALPMIYASQNKLDVDCFIVYTDNETWCGTVHPVQALAKYRSKFNSNAKLIVCGMTATNFSIADPNDPYSMDIVGFDTSTPELIGNFVRGNF